MTKVSPIESSADLGEGQEQVEGVVEVAPEIGPEIEADAARARSAMRIAAASRRAKSCPRPRGADASRLRDGALGLRRPRWRSRRVRAPAAAAGRAGAPRARPSTRRRIEPRLDQHGDEQDQPEEGRHRARRQLRHRPGSWSRRRRSSDDAGDRNALAQHLVDEHDQDGAEAGAERRGRGRRGSRRRRRSPRR